MKLIKNITLAILLLITTMAAAEDINNKLYMGKTPLHFIIASDDVTLEIVRRAVEDGMNVNGLDSEGCTPLFQVLDSLLYWTIAIYADGGQDRVPEEFYEKYIAIAEYLVQSGTDLTIRCHIQDPKLSRLSGKTFSEIITITQARCCDFMNESDDDHQKACFQKMMSLIDKLQTVVTA